MTLIERDYGYADYCVRCKQDIHMSDFRDKVAIDTYNHWGTCQSCQRILEGERDENL